MRWNIGNFDNFEYLKKSTFLRDGDVTVSKTKTKNYENIYVITDYYH